MKFSDKKEYTVDAYSGVAGKVLVQEINGQYDSLIIFNYFMPVYYLDDQIAGFDWQNIIDDYEHYNDLTKIIGNRDIIEVTIMLLEQGFYIHSYLDHFYISNSDKYLKRHFLHDCATVVDMDKKNKIFYIADNFKSGKFGVEEVKFDEYKKSMENAKGEVIEYFWMESTIQFRLNKDQLLSIIKTYLHGTGYQIKDNVITARKQQGMVYGLKMYSVLLDECEKMKKYNCNYGDYRSFQIMYDHMKVGEKMILYLQQEKYLNEAFDNEYKNLKKELEIIRNLFIKVRIKKDEKILIKVKRKIEETEKKERTFLENVIKIIK